MDEIEDPAVTVVIATRDRASELVRTLEELERLEPAPPVTVVDNGSNDGTVTSVRAAFPAVRIIEEHRNRGAAARNDGARAATTRYVAFADDDSWWTAGALELAAAILDAHDDVALIAGAILVGADRRLDPTCIEMARGDASGSAPGPRVHGFLACSAIVRREAFLAVGGFCERYGVGGEEALLAIDLIDAGWSLVYRDDVIAIHEPSKVRDVRARRRTVARNAVWTSWLRRPFAVAAASTLHVLATFDRAALLGVWDATRSIAWVVRNRRVVASTTERSLPRVAIAGGSGDAPRARRTSRTDEMRRRT